MDREALMKIAVVLGAFSIGTRPIDFNNLWDSPRGLTGTDLCYVRTVEELEKLGHEVAMFTGVNKLDGIDDSFDAVVSINEPNLLIGLPKKPLKLVWQMLNDFSFVQPGYDDSVDHYFGVCDQHTEHMKKQAGTTPSKWSTLSLGCDPDLYTDGLQVPGRVVWCSSADRGLHWLLSVWGDIKQAVPHASLRVFYHFNYDHIIGVEPGATAPQGGPYHPNILEMAQRVRYIKDAMPKLAHLDVKHVGSVSRNQMVKEWNEASVFGFSADTVAFSEGFSVSTLEAHASYTVPIITDVDCLGGIYRDSACIMLPMQIKDNLPTFRNAVIEELRGNAATSTRLRQCRQFAERHTWAQAAKKLETYIQENKR